MKIKILLTGNHNSSHQFLQSLQSQVHFTQHALSLNKLGTGTYKFRLGNDDIEIMHIEDHELPQKNIKNYAVGVNGMILMNADQATTDLIKASFPKGTPLAIHLGDSKVDGMNGVKIIVEKCHARQNDLTSNPTTQFTKKPIDKKSASTNESINFELMKDFINKTPKRTLH